METKFLDNINANLGIIYKVCNIYANSGSDEREDLFQEIWSENKHTDSSKVSVTPEYVDQIISTRLKKVKSNFREYFWASFFYQNLVYGCLAFLIVRYFGRPDVVIPSVLGILLYIPFTIIFMKKFKSVFQPNKEGIAYSDDDIYLNIKNSYTRMSEFIRFKKRFDWVIVPLNCVLIVLINFILFVPGGIEANLTADIILLIVWHVIFIIAIRIENKKKFKEPLRQLEMILDEFKHF